MRRLGRWLAAAAVLAAAAGYGLVNTSGHDPARWHVDPATARTGANPPGTHPPGPNPHDVPPAPGRAKVTHTGDGDGVQHRAVAGEGQDPGVGDGNSVGPPLYPHRLDPFVQKNVGRQHGGGTDTQKIHVE